MITARLDVHVYPTHADDEAPRRFWGWLLYQGLARTSDPDDYETIVTVAADDGDVYVRALTIEGRDHEGRSESIAAWSYLAPLGQWRRGWGAWGVVPEPVAAYIAYLVETCASDMQDAYDRAVMIEQREMHT